MKKLTHLIILALVAFASVSSVSADPRLETTQGNCHFPSDINNADNEWKVGDCKVAGKTLYNKGYATATYSYKYNLIDFRAQNLNTFKMRGAGFKHWLEADTPVLNTPCTVVMSNYNASTGVNDYQEYKTNNWMFRNEASRHANPDEPYEVAVTMTLSCNIGRQVN